VAKARTALADIEFGPSQHLLEVRELAVEFNTDYGNVHAVNGISDTLDAGETLSSLGESASGKRVSALAIMGLIDRPGRIAEGQILY
jgi:ABC-type dipeptide/oligopeptide/nickel transport system ATPase component